MALTHYERLEIQREATRDEIKAAYRRKALRTHPDLRHGSAEQIKQANKEFAFLSEAYATLIDPDRRAAYESLLEPISNEGSGDKESNLRRTRKPSASEVLKDLALIDETRREIWDEPRSKFIKNTLQRMLIWLPLFSVFGFACTRLVIQGDLAGLPWALGAGLSVVFLVIDVWLRFERILASKVRDTSIVIGGIETPSQGAAKGAE